MRDTTLTAQGASGLARYVDDRRVELQEAICSAGSAARSDRGVAAAFATTFLERLSAELADFDETSSQTWAHECERANAAQFAQLAVIAGAVVAACYSAENVRASEVAAYLALRSSDLEKRFLERSTIGRDDVVASLLAAIEARDTATCEHSRAVGMWCGRLAKSLGMSAREQDFCAVAGTLHDVGKVSTPTEILQKPGPLDPDEWETMRAHAAAGGRMLERIPALREYASVVRAHHERLDGRGYPDRLSGASIPMTARIVSVADSFHAMISRRPYREALPVPHAIEELRGGSGTQWDGAVIEAMLRIVQPAGEQRALRVVRAVR